MDIYLFNNYNYIIFLTRILIMKKLMNCGSIKYLVVYKVLLNKGSTIIVSIVDVFFFLYIYI